MFKQNKEVNPDNICNKCLRTVKRREYRYAKDVASRQIMSIALRSGHLIKQPCEECGQVSSVDGHHPDYEKPLDVIWLCKVHHAREHARLRKLLAESDV